MATFYFGKDNQQTRAPTFHMNSHDVFHAEVRLMKLDKRLASGSWAKAVQEYHMRKQREAMQAAVESERERNEALRAANEKLEHENDRLRTDNRDKFRDIKKMRKTLAETKEHKNDALAAAAAAFAAAAANDIKKDAISAAEAAFAAANDIKEDAIAAAEAAFAAANDIKKDAFAAAEAAFAAAGVLSVNATHVEAEDAEHTFVDDVPSFSVDNNDTLQMLKDEGIAVTATLVVEKSCVYETKETAALRKVTSRFSKFLPWSSLLPQKKTKIVTDFYLLLVAGLLASLSPSAASVPSYQLTRHTNETHSPLHASSS